MENAKVSVVIPAYNAEKTLRQCLNSILVQTYENYEVIAVDNNSADKTRDIIKEYEIKSKKVIYVFEPFRSRSSARNAGIKRASGEIIVMTDSDCIAPKDWILELTSSIFHEGESAVIGSEEDLIENYWTKNIQRADFEYLERNIKGKYVSHVDTKNFAIKTSIIKKVMFDPEIKATEDYEFFLRLRKTTPIIFIPEIKVGHHHSSSFRKFVKSSFERGYWAKKIYEKHRQTADLEKEVMMENIPLKNLLLFFPWLILQFIKRPLNEAYFILIAEVSWRTGVLWSAMKK